MSEAGENEDNSYSYGQSYVSTTYSLDALTAAAQEAANDYSWELSSSSSPVRPHAGRGSSEELPPLVCCATHQPCMLIAYSPNH